MEGRVVLALLFFFFSFSFAIDLQITTSIDNTGLDYLSNYPIVAPNGSTTVVFVATASQLPLNVSISIINSTFEWSPISFTWYIQQNRSSFPLLLTPTSNTTGVETIHWGASIVNGASFGEIATTEVEISCSDGNSCNGNELFVDGACQYAIAPFCDYGSCVTSTCDSEDGVCRTTLHDSCEECYKNCDYLGCDNRQCGTDGCGGNCGTCAEGTYCDSEGQCVVVATEGVCTNPIKLFNGTTNLTGVHYFTGNNSKGYHRHVIECNLASTSPEYVYTFTVPEGQSYGFDIRTYGFDTVLDVRKDSCEGEFIGCNDDATPPSNYGSRVARLIGPGQYFIIVKGYSVEYQGEFTLYISFQPGCVPKCNSQFCGPDECGGTCGECLDGETCSENFKCIFTNCVPDCDGNECGFDGCGGNCGTCANGKLCNLDSNKCEEFPECDGLNPVCTGCNETQFCGTDCQCYNQDADLPDLYIERERLASDITFDYDVFKETSCAYREGCITGIGRRRLLRFTVVSTNQGRAPAIMPHAPSRPDLFTYSPCHGHYHFDDYAYYGLLTTDGVTVVEHGRKQGYCLLDTARQVNGSIDCVGNFNCETQGISPGWADVYTYDLDCQWIDITDTPAGEYLLYVELNKLRKIAESDYSNNKAWVSVTIPPESTTTTTTTTTTSTTTSTTTPTTASTSPTTTTTTTSELESPASTVFLSLVCIIACTVAAWL